MAIVAHGTLVAAVCVAAFWITWGGDEARLPHARTVTFCVASFAQLLFALGCRSASRTTFELGFVGNPSILLAVLLSALLQIAVVMLPPAQPVFEVTADPGRDWPLVVGLSLVPLAVVELAKTAFRLRPCTDRG